MPVHELLGGTVRNHCECYGTRRCVPAGAGGKPGCRCADRAKAAMDAGYRAFRMGAADCRSAASTTRTRRSAACRSSARKCGKASARTATGASTSTSASTSTTRCAPAGRSKSIEPYFVEDPVRDEHALQDLPKLRQMTDGPAHARRRVGPALGLQQARREPRHRLHPRHAAQRRRHHRDDEDRGASAKRTPSASFRTSPDRSRPRRWSTACRRSPGP